MRETVSDALESKLKQGSHLVVKHPVSGVLDKSNNLAAHGKALA